MAASGMSPGPSTSSRNRRQSNSAMERVSQWVFTQEFPTDVSVVVGEANFPLHKFPLVSKSGYMRRMVAEVEDNNLSSIQLAGIPGGPKAFEEAAKFCYGTNFEITPHNVSALRCAAEYLEMTEEYSPCNLISRTEDYLHKVVFDNFSASVTALHACKNLLPMAEELNIVSRCIEASASMAATEFYCNSKPMLARDWWAEELTVLRIDFYQRVLVAMKDKGLPYPVLGSSLMLYAQKPLQVLVRRRSQDKVSNASEVEKEQRILLETIISLLPSEQNTMSVSFLCSLLRSAIYLESREVCRMNLERRIAHQLEQATEDDLLTISSINGAEAISNLDSIFRIVMNFLEVEKRSGFPDGLDGYCSPSVSKVCRTMDGYLAAIAPAANLGIENFIALPKLMPRVARDLEDGLYRAIDIYLKAHPSLDELEREKVCSVMDSHRLSQEARAHASQNKRLPVHFLVQVLFYDKLQSRSITANPDNNLNHHWEADDQQNPSPKPLVVADANVAGMAVSDANVAALWKQNEELKMEVARMKISMRDLHNNQQQLRQQKKASSSFLSSVTKKLGKLNPFARNSSKDSTDLCDADDASIKLPARRRRYSIS